MEVEGRNRNLTLTFNDADSLRKDFEDICRREKLSKEALNVYLSNPVLNLTTIKELQKKICAVLEESLAQSPDIYKAIKNFKDTYDLLLIKGFPFTSADEVYYGELLQLGMARLFNMNPFTYASEHSGRLLHHVRPIESDANKQTALGSRDELRLHTENSFDDGRPDFLSLYCLNGNRNARTLLIAFQDVLALADEELRGRILTLGLEKEFEVCAPPSFESTNKDGPEPSELVLKMPDGRGFGIRFDLRELLKGKTERASQLLDDLFKLIDVNRKELNDKMSITLEQGDLLVWNNHTVVHGRSSYDAKFDDKTERFLVRMYMCRNLDLPQFRG